MNDVIDIPYSDTVAALFEAPRHAGTLRGEDVLSAVAGSRAQGAQVQLQIQVEGDEVRTARFMAYGCPHLLAAAECLAQWLEGRSRAEVQGWSSRGVESALEVPAEKRGRLLLLEDALRSLTARWAVQPS